MKTKKILCLICCFAIAVTTTVFASDTSVNYSSVVPKSLLLDTWSGAPQSEWIVIKNNSQTAAGNYSNLGSNGITAKAMGVTWIDTTASNFMKVGKFKNSMQVAYFTKSSSGSHYVANPTEGALGFKLTNADAEAAGGCVAVVSKKNMKYGASNINSWGGYSEEKSSGRLVGYDQCVAAGNLVSLYNIPSFTNTNSYYVVGLYVEENVDRESTYLTLYTAKSTSAPAKRYAFGVPLKNYVTDDMVGKYVEVAVPVMDFLNSQDKVVQFVTTGTATDDGAPTNFNALIGMGLMKKVGTAAESDEKNFVYLLKQQIVKMTTPSSVTVSKTDDPYNGYYETLSINHNNSETMDNDITAFEITLKDADDQVLFTKTIPVDEFTKASSTDSNGNAITLYKYVIGAKSPAGAKYYVSAVAGELVGNDDIGYMPVKSTAKTVATSWGIADTSPSVQYVKASGGRWVAVDNRMFYDCKIIIARYNNDGTQLRQADVFDPIGEKCFVEYLETANGGLGPINNNIIKVFVWTNDSELTPLAEAVIEAAQ